MLTTFIQTWSSIYSDHATMRTAVEFVHIGGLVAGGGCAITADLATIGKSRDRAAVRATQVHLLERTHAIVVSGIAALTASGVLLLAADLDTYLHSTVFWLKMGLFALLLANGALMLAGERRVKRGDPRAWTRLHYTAISSLVLWTLTMLAGAALPNLG
jgi:hypothetical protein